MDSGIKLFVLFILGIAPFFITCSFNVMLLLAYLLLATLTSGIKWTTIFKNILAYIIVIVLPYTVGLLMADAISRIVGSEVISFHSSIQEVAPRLFQLFILWYVGILYFNSTKIERVIGLVHKLLSPLKAVGVPVADFLKVIMCVINELKELAPDAKKSFYESINLIFRSSRNLSNSRIKEISKVIVAFIVNSFERLGKVEEYVEQVEDEELFTYSFTITRTDILVFISLLMLIAGFIFLSNTVCIG